MAVSKTGTGLDRLVTSIQSDKGIARKVSSADIEAGAQAASDLNQMILDGIKAMGVANDGSIDAADLRAIGDWIQLDASRFQEYRALYGTKNGNRETGFRLVENEDSSSRLFGEDAVDEVADAIYSIGFGYDNGRLFDVNGNPYRSVVKTASWLDDLLTNADLASLVNPNGLAVVEGTTGTGLDELIEIIQIDSGLIRNVSRYDMAIAARAADEMNEIYLEGIAALGIANDGTIDKADVVSLDAWVRSDAARVAQYRDLNEDWRLVVNKGADLATVDSVNDGVHPHKGHVVNHGLVGVYQIGNGSKGGVLFDHKGNTDVGARVAAAWLDQLLTDAEKNALDNPGGTTAVPEPNTSTGLDQIVDVIEFDKGLIRNVSREDIAEAARAADGMNQIIVEAIEALGVANDGRINDRDVERINEYIQSDDALHDEFLMLRGGTGANESGFQLVRNDGGSEKLYGKWAVNNVFDGIYSIGFDIERNKFLNDSGNPSYSVVRVAEWLDELYIG